MASRQQNETYLITNFDKAFYNRPWDVIIKTKMTKSLLRIDFHLKWSVFRRLTLTNVCLRVSDERSLYILFCSNIILRHFSMSCSLLEEVKND